MESLKRINIETTGETIVSFEKLCDLYNLLSVCRMCLN